MAPHKNDNWIRNFEVTDPIRHKKGFTIYKVTSVVFPKTAPEAATRVIVWKRFNDFKVLHKNLKYYCKQCRISEELPQLSKAKYFNRFEEDVIKERMECALQLLNFIGRHRALFTCEPFLEFFNNGYKVSSPSSPSSYYDNTLELTDNGNAETHSGDNCNVINGETQRNGLLKQNSTNSHLPHETFSVQSQSSDDESFLASDTAESISPSSSLASPSKTNGSSPNKKQPFNETTTTSRNFTETSVEDPASMMPDHKPPGTNHKLGMAKSMSYLPNHFGETVTCYSEKPTKPNEMWLSVRTQDFNSTASPDLTDNEVWLTPPGTPSDKQNYIIEAAYHIGHAQNYESSGEYEAAFSFYKAAIACLLSGVHDDEDESRRQIVKEKTSRYLQRAEKMYALHLSCNKKASCNEKVTRTVEDLKVYKVLSIIDKVMLVTNTIENKCYVIKVLEKSPCPIDTKKKTIIPLNVPYMVKLVKYFENDDSIFLILEYATGGRLWDHIDNFIHSRSSSVNNLHLKESQSMDFGDKILENDDKSYLDLIKDYTANAAKKIFGYDLAESISNDKTDFNESTVVNDVKEEINHSNHIPCLVKNDIEETIKELNIENLDVTDLVQNSQRLLNSVNKTLLNSEKVTDNLNKELKNIESVFDLNGKLQRNDHCKTRIVTESKSHKKRSCSAVRYERRYSFEDLADSRSRTASNSLDRGGQWSRLEEMIQPPRLSESTVRIWAAELLVALETLHRWGVVCKDLRPDNVLLNDECRLLLSFQSHWSGVDSLVSEEAVEGFYAAPEVTSVFPVTAAADWWSFGALLHKLVTGKDLSSCYPSGVYSHTILTFPEYVSSEACSLLTELLRYEPSERLGGGINGSDDIKCHPFFNSIDWQLIYEN